MTTFVNDTFTDTDGVTLNAHTAEAGSPWLRTGTVIDATINSNKLHYNGVSGANSTVWQATTTPSVTEYDIDADLTLVTANAATAYFCGRGTASMGSYYYARFTISTATWDLGRLGGAGGSAVLGSYVDAGFVAGVTRHVKLQIRDAAKKLFIDGVERATSSDNDSTLIPAGRVGIRLTGAATPTTGLALDNFIAATAVPAPVNTVAPAITGTAIVGQTVSCSTGTWTNSPSSFAYQWKRNGAVISGATVSTYLLANPDIAQSITCAVTATNATGSTSADSNAIVPADILPPPTNTTAPVVTTLGYATTGHVASCTTGSWANTPTSYAYQWTRDGSNISGATSSTYTLAVADEGHAIRCAVTATNAAGTGTANSNIINAEANHSVATQTDIVYQGSATGLTGSVFATIIKLDDASVVSARSSTAITELVAGSGTYRCRRSLDAGRYVAQFDEGTYTPATITPVPVSV